MLETYLGISVIIGLIVIYDGYLIVKSNGVVETGQLTIFTSIIDFFWAIVSVVALFILEFQNCKY